MSHDPHILPRGFITYVRPIPEYCSPVWSPYYKCDIVQHTFTPRLFRKCHLQYATYDERLALLGLQKLHLRRLCADLVYMYKLLHGQISISLNTALSYAKCSKTRGHKYKLFVCRCKKLVFSTFFYQPCDLFETFYRLHV